VRTAKKSTTQRKAPRTDKSAAALSSRKLFGELDPNSRTARGAPLTANDKPARGPLFSKKQPPPTAAKVRFDDDDAAAAAPGDDDDDDDAESSTTKAHVPRQQTLLPGGWRNDDEPVCHATC